VRLDRLRDVSEAHLVQWQDLKPVRQFLGRGDFTLTIQRFFREATADPLRDGLPMRFVIDKLDRWLRRSIPGV
jgi:hypothetical protein